MNIAVTNNVIKTYFKLGASKLLYCLIVKRNLRETLINAAMRSFAAQGNVFSCQSRQLTTAGGSGWPWCRQADASVLRARYRFASANSENTWAPFLAMPR